jgi:hypothetical protein
MIPGAIGQVHLKQKCDQEHGIHLGTHSLIPIEAKLESQ